MRVVAKGVAEATTIEVAETMTETGTETGIGMTVIEAEATEENGAIATDTMEEEEVEEVVIIGIGTIGVEVDEAAAGTRSNPHPSSVIVADNLSVTISFTGFSQLHALELLYFTTNYCSLFFRSII
ncbi:hypothetical protein YQE_07240, partial [Dendroctonus ponderosae]